MTTRNYTYGLRPPIENRDRVMDQLRKASDYRNKLVEIELARRAATDQTLRELCPGLLECEAALAEVTTQIDDVVAQQKGRNQRARGMTDEADFREKLAELKPRRRELAAKRKDLRVGSFATAETQERLAAVNETSAAAVRTARAACGVFWGSYLLVEQAANMFRKGAPPVFRGFRGEGRIAVQLQGGMTWADATSGGDTRLRIVHSPQTEVRTTCNGTILPLPGAKQQSKLYTFWLRIGSDGRAPVWATWPMILHRVPPDGARIKWAIVQRRIIAGRERWSLTLSLEAEAFRRPQGDDDDVGVDVGYRSMPDGSLRVAYVHGSDGAGRDYRIDAGKIAEFRKVEDLQSIRDQHHNETRAALRDWLASHECPVWLVEATEHMHVWKRLSRLDQLVVQWRGQRFDGDEEILSRLETWRTKERHLWQYQENLRDQLVAWRKDFYRNVAADLTRQYRRVIVEQLDLRELHDVLRTAEDRDVHTPQRHAARTANLSLLLRCLREAARDFVVVDPAGTTSTCHICGGACEWDHAAHIRHTCEHCGAEWDQDDNAARNILARGVVATKTRGSLADDTAQGVASGNGSAKRPSRSQRLVAARKSRSGVKQAKELG